VHWIGSSKRDAANDALENGSGLEDEVTASRGGEVEDSFRVAGGGFFDARAAAASRGLFFEFRPAYGEADCGEPEEDEAENGLGVFGRFQTGVGAKLIGCIEVLTRWSICEGISLQRSHAFSSVDSVHLPSSER